MHVSIPGFLGAGDSRCKDLLRHVDRCLRRHLAPRDDGKSPEIVIKTINGLVGGLEYFLFSPIVGMMIQSDFHIFQGG